MIRTHHTRIVAPLALASGLASAAGPDITTSDLTSITSFGQVNGLHAYAFGFDACNVGDQPIEWASSTNRHPVLVSQLYRLADGRFEQIGLSNAFHEFFPLQLDGCGTCVPSDIPEPTLGPGCRNANSAGIAGAQSTLGPRTEIDAASGAFPFPPTGFTQTGDAIFKRLRASTADLSDTDARYFFEGLYITPDDALAGNADNNASYREAAFTPGSLNASFTDATVQGLPAIYAWQAADPGVMITEAEAPDGGRYIVASRAYEFDTGEWRYEYAVMNLNSSDNAVAFEAPHRGVTDFPIAFDPAFHDVDYHSGDTVDGTDWTPITLAFSERWDAQPVIPAGDLLPNAIRYGTLYNFGYSSFNAPVETTVRVVLDSGVSLQVAGVASGVARCGEGDYAEPYFVLDLSDLQTYIELFLANAADADIRPPFNVLDLGDLQAFISGFSGGCD